MKKSLIVAAVTVLTAGCAYDRGCNDGWNAFGDPYGDGVVYDDGAFGDMPLDGVEGPVYLPDGSMMVGPEIIVPGGETIPAPAGEPLPGPAE